MVRPISALRYSSTKYPGFGLNPSSGYQTPAAPAAPAAVTAVGGGGGVSELIRPQDREGRDGGGEGGGVGGGGLGGGAGVRRPGAPATLEESFQLNRALSNPLAQVVGMALPTPLNLIPLALRAITGGPLATGEQRTFNAARTSPNYETGLNPAEAERVTDPYFDMNESDFTPAGGGEATGGLTERAAAGNLGPVGVTSEAISGPSTQYSGPAQTAPSEVGQDGGGGGGDIGRGNDPGGGAAGSPFHQGGPVTDQNPATYQENMEITAQEGEVVMSRPAVAALGPDFFKMINEAVQQAGGMPPGALEAMILEAVTMSPQQTGAGTPPPMAAAPQAGPVPPQGGPPVPPVVLPPQGGPPVPPVSPQGPSTSLAGQRFRR